MTYNIQIDGIKCPHCEERIRSALAGLAGVTAVDIQGSRAMVTADETVTGEDLRNAVCGAGESGMYTVSGIDTVSDSFAVGACCSGRHKMRTEKERKDLMNRLKRIEGQVRGVESMLEKDAYCPDVLIQVSAINAALNSFNKVLLASHVRTCVADDIRDGHDEVVDELVMLLQKLMK